MGRHGSSGPFLAVMAALALAALFLHLPLGGSTSAPQAVVATVGLPDATNPGTPHAPGISIPESVGMFALRWAVPGWGAANALRSLSSGRIATGRTASKPGASGPVEAFPPNAVDPPNARPPDPVVPPPDIYGKDPVVGIYHTGTTEAYAPALVAAGKEPARYSLDQAVTVVQVGAVLCETLSRLGVGCVHSRALNDPDGPLGAYENSLRTARALLAAYPTVRILLDLHRLDTAQGVGAAEGNGRVTAAPVTLVVGTDDLLPDPHWRQNLAFARVLQAAARRLYPSWPLQVEVSPNQYNQELAVGALLVEVGAVNTSLAQADRGAVRLAHVLQAVLASGLAPKPPAP